MHVQHRPEDELARSMICRQATSAGLLYGRDKCRLRYWVWPERERNKEWSLKTRGLGRSKSYLTSTEGDGRGSFKGEEMRTRDGSVIRSGFPSEKGRPEGLLLGVGGLVGGKCGAGAGAGEVMVG